MNFFELLNLPEGFDIDLAALEKAYFAAQRAHHPDKLVQADEKARLAAVQQSMQVNDAYDTLKSPLTRADYLLMLRGHIAFDENTTVQTPELLMEMMELREQMQDAAEDGRALLQLVADTKKAAQDCVNDLSAAFKAEDYETAKSTHLRLQYLHKALEEAHIFLYRAKAQGEANLG